MMAQSSAQGSKEGPNLSRIIFGGAAFSHFYSANLDTDEVPRILQRSLSAGITSIDTSPYYGDSEIVIGNALRKLPGVKRTEYQLCTKAGRIAMKEFDYSYNGIIASVKRSLQRLGTNYLDIVYCHDVEFQNLNQIRIALSALADLKKKGVIRFVGISAYPLSALLNTCESLPGQIDVVMSYCHFHLQNTTLQAIAPKIKHTGVKQLLNASPLCMGLLRSQGLPGAWHPASSNYALLRDVREAAYFCEKQGEDLAEMATRFALSKWPGSTVLGMSSIVEVESALRSFESVQSKSHLDQFMYDQIRGIIRDCLDWEWQSPPE